MSVKRKRVLGMIVAIRHKACYKTVL